MNEAMHCKLIPGVNVPVDRIMFCEAPGVVMTTPHVKYAPERGKGVGCKNQPSYDAGSQDQVPILTGSSGSNCPKDHSVMKLRAVF